MPYNQRVTNCLSETSFSADNFNGMIQLFGLAVGKFTGVKDSKPVDDLPLTVKEIKERKLNHIENTLKAAIDKFGPKSSLNNTTISKVARNNTLTMN